MLLSWANTASKVLHKTDSGSIRMIDYLMTVPTPY